MRRAGCLFALLALSLWAQPQPTIMPLADVQAGMQGVGKTVFSGSTVEEFKVEILGILENAGPKQSIILARLSGGPLEHTGVMQGMSGSPVYIGGKLAGAVAFSFPFAKDPIAGIRPIEEMLATTPNPQPPRAVRADNPFDLASLLPKPQSVEIGPSRMTEIATPLWLGGMTRATFDHFAPMLRSAGFEPAQGLSGGGQPRQATPNAASQLKPGSMISVQLITGDLAAGADGTVTHIDGRTVYAFGHRFMSSGDTEMPFALAEVMTLLANQNSSFKISKTTEWLGVITQDRNTAINGVLGRKASMLPVSIRVNSRGGVSRNWSYRMELVNDRLLTPLLLQMAVFSAIDATERTTGLASVGLRARLGLDRADPIQFENLYTAEIGAPNMVSAALAAPVAAIMQGGFDDLRLTSLDIELDVTNEKKQLQIESLWPSKREAEPGETIELTALFTGENGQEMTKTVPYTIPVGAQSGPLYFTLVDGMAANLAEYRQFLFNPPRTRTQLLAFLSGLRPNTKSFVRVWRGQPSWQVQGETLPAPPPSLALLLGSNLPQLPSAKVDEIELASGGYMMSGTKTVVVEVKR